MGQEFVKTLPGITAPIGFFDPLGLTPESKEDVLVWREAEVMHGRVAMMATVGFVVQESFHPLFPRLSAAIQATLNRVSQTCLATRFALKLPHRR